MDRLNHRITINCTKYEKEQLNRLSSDFGLSVTKLSRSILNYFSDLVCLVGKENIYFKLNKVIILNDKGSDSK